MGTDSRDVIEEGLEAFLLSSETVEGDGEAVSLISDILEKLEGRGGSF